MKKDREEEFNQSLAYKINTFWAASGINANAKVHKIGNEFVVRSDLTLLSKPIRKGY